MDTNLIDQQIAKLEAAIARKQRKLEMWRQKQMREREVAGNKLDESNSDSDGMSSKKVDVGTGKLDANRSNPGPETDAVSLRSVSSAPTTDCPASYSLGSGCLGLQSTDLRTAEEAIGNIRLRERVMPVSLDSLESKSPKVVTDDDDMSTYCSREPESTELPVPVTRKSETAPVQTKLGVPASAPTTRVEVRRSARISQSRDSSVQSSFESEDRGGKAGKSRPRLFPAVPAPFRMSGDAITDFELPDEILRFTTKKSSLGFSQWKPQASQSSAAVFTNCEDSDIFAEPSDQNGGGISSSSRACISRTDSHSAIRDAGGGDGHPLRLSKEITSPPEIVSTLCFGCPLVGPAVTVHCCQIDGATMVILGQESRISVWISISGDKCQLVQQFPVKLNNEVCGCTCLCGRVSAVDPLLWLYSVVLDSLRSTTNVRGSEHFHQISDEATRVATTVAQCYSGLDGLKIPTTSWRFDGFSSFTKAGMFVAQDVDRHQVVSFYGISLLTKVPLTVVNKEISLCSEHCKILFLDLGDDHVVYAHVNEDVSCLRKYLIRADAIESVLVLDQVEDNLNSLLTVENQMNAIIGVGERMIYIWNQCSGVLVRTISTCLAIKSCWFCKSESGILFLGLSILNGNDGQRLQLLAHNPVTSVWIDTGIRYQDDHRQVQNGLIYSLKNGRYLFGVTSSGSIHVWNFYTGNLMFVAEECGATSIDVLRISEMESLLAVGYTSGKVKTYKMPFRGTLRLNYKRQ